MIGKLESVVLDCRDPHAAAQRIADQVRAEIRRQWDVLRRLRGGP